MNTVRPPDLGTPPSDAQEDVEIVIDGHAVTTQAGVSVLRAAREAGIDVPKLCATDSLKPFGSCRLCLVEIDGQRGYPASCTTPVSDGMRVRTQTPALAKLRRNVMELYISDHPLDCLTCSANGDCELQDMAGAVGLREVRYGFDGANHLDADTDTSNPYFSFDPSKCIVCSRCVRACDEIQGTFALTIDGRGFDAKVSASVDEPFLDSECVSCGACVQACPTATLMEKSIVEHGQPERARSKRPARIAASAAHSQRRDEGRPGRAHDAVQERQSQSRPQLCQRPLRMGLLPLTPIESSSPMIREAHRRALANPWIGKKRSSMRHNGFETDPGERHGR